MLVWLVLARTCVKGWCACGETVSPWCCGPPRTAGIESDSPDLNAHYTSVLQSPGSHSCIPHTTSNAFLSFHAQVSVLSPSRLACDWVSSSLCQRLRVFRWGYLVPKTDRERLERARERSSKTTQSKRQRKQGERHIQGHRLGERDKETEQRVNLLGLCAAST